MSLSLHLVLPSAGCRPRAIPVRVSVTTETETIENIFSLWRRFFVAICCCNFWRRASVIICLNLTTPDLFSLFPFVSLCFLFFSFPLLAFLLLFFFGLGELGFCDASHVLSMTLLLIMVSSALATWAKSWGDMDL